jgi:hypothetical protein
MKLSEDTVSILKNFAAINPNLTVREGSELQTLSDNDALYSKATIKEKFPSEFGIWDLNQLLSVISMFDSPDVKFNKNSLTIYDSDRSATYRYSPLDLLKALPKNKIKFPKAILKFNLSSDHLTQLTKASSVMGLGDLKIVADKKEVNVVLHDKKDETSNQFTVLVSEGKDATFKGKQEHIISASSLVILPGNYTVEIAEIADGNQGIARFTHDALDVVYLIALEPKK